MDFYRCFVCEVTLKDKKDFDSHLKRLSHVRCLEERKLISSEHVDLLILLDLFKLGNASRVREREIGGSGASQHREAMGKQNKETVNSVEKEVRVSSILGFSSGSNAEHSECEGSSISFPPEVPLPLLQREAPFSQQGLPKLLPSQALRVKLSVECKMCLESLTNFDCFKSHLTCSSHEKLKKHYSPQFKPFECRACEEEFGEADVCSHVAVVHLNISSILLTHMNVANLVYECIACEKYTSTVISLREHLASKKHKQKSHPPSTGDSMRCRLCNEGFNTIPYATQHEVSLRHQMRKEVLKLFFRCSQK